jgi:hypothetical protein
MLKYSTTILKFDKQGEKTGWTYIVVPADIAQELNPGVKKSYRVKGKLDQFSFSGMSLLPMGEGEFILALKGDVRKAIGKKHGAMLNVQLERDTSEYEINLEFLACLKDAPEADKIFSALPASHQRYYSKWIESAKTDATRAKRIALAVNSFLKKQTFAEMLRAKSI